MGATGLTDKDNTESSFATAHLSLVSKGGEPTVPNKPRHKPRPLFMHEFALDFVKLIEGSRVGHLSRYEYANGGMILLEEFLRSSPNYYIPNAEKALIQRCASASASLLNEQEVKKITLVTRGPGTLFEAKEGSLILAFQEAGIEIAKVVYIDASKVALNRSRKEGEQMLPNAKHEIYQQDIFDPKTKDFYKIEGVEVGVCFGLTPMNAEGWYDAASPPLSAVQKNLTGIRGQMKKGAHFIAAYDHNADKESLESMFDGRDEMAKHMLEYHLGWKDLDDIKLVAKYGESSQILSHGFHFSKDRKFELGGTREIKAGTTLWFNNSVKLSRQLTEECNERVGFSYPSQERVIMAHNNRLGYHHTIAS